VQARFRGGVVALAVGLVLLVPAALAGTVASAPTAIPIGALLSLTGGGNVYGPQQAKAAELAVAQLNAQGGVDGVPLKLVIRDDRSNPAYGRKMMQRLIQKDGVIAVLGPTLSIVAVASDSLANQLQTTVLAVSNTANGIVGKCAYACTWVWRDSLGESIAVPANVSEYVLEAHPSSAALIFVDHDVLGQDEAELASATFAQNSVKIATRGLVNTEGTNVASVVAKAVAKKPGVIFVGASFGGIAAEVMKDARKDGYTGTFLGGNTFNSGVTAGLAGSAGVDARSASAWYAGNDFPANTSFESSYRQRYGSAPDQFAAQAYVGVNILADALGHGAATSTKPLAARRAMVQASMDNVALTTPLGPFRFTADHDVSQIVWILAITKTGGHRLVGFCNPTC
jgi:branched-chain amino acid transport system substrate-binding protein